MDNDALPIISQQLSDDANKIGKGKPYPISVESILSELRLGLVFEPRSSTRYHGSLSHRSGRWCVVVSRKDPQSERKLSARERFTIAHEIAHYIIEARFKYKPLSREDYWKLEDLCNAFAARLLIPEQFTSKAIDSVHDAVSMSRSIIEISKTTETSLEVASRRLVACIDHAAAVAQVNVDDSRRVSIVWAAENMPWLACERGALLDCDHPLRPVIISGLTLSPPWCRPIQLNGLRDACMRRDNARQVTIFALPERARLTVSAM